MDDPFKNVPVSPGVSNAPPILEYRPPRDERPKDNAADLIKAGIAISLGTLMLVPAAAITFQGFLGKSDEIDHIVAWTAILLLLLAGVAASVRCAWFYFGGWANTPDRGKAVRKIAFPWNWR